MNLLFTICARAGSKGVRNKNIRDFCGVPIVGYTLAAYELFCERYGSVYDTIDLAVNTDSDELEEQIMKTDISHFYIQRTKELAGDEVSKIRVIHDTMCKAEEEGNIRYDCIVDLDLTSPLRTVADIRGTVELMQNSDAADIAYSVTDSRRSPFFNMVCRGEDGYYNTVMASDYVCRQQAPECLDMNASIYAYARNYLKTENLGKRKALVWKMTDTGILDIDGEHDMELMQVIGAYFFQEKDEYREICSRAEALFKKRYGNEGIE